MTKYTREQQRRAFAAGPLANTCIAVALAIAVCVTVWGLVAESAAWQRLAMECKVVK